MQFIDCNRNAFLALVRAGLWGKKVNLLTFDKVDFDEIYRYAQEQSVVGLVAAGLELVENMRIPQGIALQMAGEVLQLEQRNKAMNAFVARLISELRKKDVYALLVKGQGIARCYERPLWRAAGDVDLLLSEENYQRAKSILLPLANTSEKVYSSFKHLSMMIDGFEVELHGTLHTRLSKRVDDIVDIVQADVFFGGNVRPWLNGKTQVFLPGVNNDVIFLLTHILHHFYVEGIGLRQICDWCRFLWTYRSELNKELLESRLRGMGLLSEWKAFGAFAVEILGMTKEAMPLYSGDKKWKRKADYILEFVLECGNFGHNRQINYANSYWGEKFRSMFRKVKDFGRHACVFPLDSVRFFFGFLKDGIGQAIRGE